MHDYVTLDFDHHQLVHFIKYTTIERPHPGEPPHPGRKDIRWYHTPCGKKIRRDEFKRLGLPSKRRFYTCVTCALSTPKGFSLFAL
jgi:hypothetical protein